MGSSPRPGENTESRAWAQESGTQRVPRQERSARLQEPPQLIAVPPQRPPRSSCRAVTGTAAAGPGPRGAVPGERREPAQSRAEPLDQIFPLLLAAFISAAASLHRQPGLLAPRCCREAEPGRGGQRRAAPGGALMDA